MWCVSSTLCQLRLPLGLKIWSRRIKKIFFYSVIIVVNYVLLELVAYGFYRLKFGDYDQPEIQLSRTLVVRSIEDGPVFTGDSGETGHKKVILKEVLHPYIGYVTDGKIRKENCESDSLQECYSRIKVATDKPFVKRSDDKLIVGVIGGSVAVATVNHSSPKGLYEHLLAKLPEYKGREIIIHSLTAGGLRQPQQLMMLNYYYSLGAEFDVLISLDGFNDVAIPVSEYRYSKIHPSYPRSWGHRMAAKVSKDLVDLVAEKQNLQATHVTRANFMSGAWLKNSPLSNLLWQLSNVNYINSVAIVDQSVAELEKKDASKRDFFYEALGPDYDFTGMDDLFQYSVDIWANSSHLIHAIAKANDVKYLHFLQPNQYIEGSKAYMSDAERKKAFTRAGYGVLYKQIYPRIVEKAEWLKERGVEFHDLTFIYKDIKEDLYIDNCCHVNSTGSNLMIEKIVDTLHQSNLSDEKENESRN